MMVETGASHPRRWAILAVICSSLLVVVIDVTVLHVAAPAISSDLDPTALQLLWIIDVYPLVAAPLLIAMVATEIALAITTRFAPTLNVFVLALAVKSLVLFIIMPLYMGLLGDQAGNLVEVIANIVPQMHLFLDAGGAHRP